MSLNITLKQFLNLSFNQKCNYLLAKKIKGYDVKSEMDLLTVEELKEFKVWIANKKETAEEERWKKKRAQRAAKL